MMERVQEQSDAPGAEGVVVRWYRKSDQPDVSRLYTDGLLIGSIDENDTGADIENIEEAYFLDRRNSFWVAEVSGRVVGTIGVAADDPHVAQVRRLRVEHPLQHTPVAAKLLEVAVYHCRYHGFVKVVFDTRFEHDAAVDLFAKQGFQHTRTRSHHGRDMLEFYLDLYHPPAKEEGKG